MFKRSLITLALLAAAGSAAAQQTIGPFGILNGRGAAAALLVGSTGLPGGLGNAAPIFLAGNTVDGFVAGRNGFSSAVIVLTAETPRLHGLRDATVQGFNNTYNALLPLYQAVDPVLMTLTGPAAPVLTPVGVQIAAGAAQLARVIDGNALRFNRLVGRSSTSLPGLDGLAFRR